MYCAVVYTTNMCENVSSAGLICICHGVKLPVGEANMGSYWLIASGAAGSLVVLQHQEKLHPSCIKRAMHYEESCMDSYQSWPEYIRQYILKSPV